MGKWLTKNILYSIFLLIFVFVFFLSRKEVETYHQRWMVVAVYEMYNTHTRVYAYNRPHKTESKQKPI